MKKEQKLKRLRERLISILEIKEELSQHTTLELQDVLRASQIETNPDYNYITIQANGLYLGEAQTLRGVVWDFTQNLDDQDEVVIDLLIKYFLPRNEDQGLFKKYNLSRADGEDLDPDSKYFVLRYDNGAEENHRNACRDALSMYISRIKDSHPHLAENLQNDLKEEIKKGLK